MLAVPEIFDQDDDGIVVLLEETPSEALTSGVLDAAHTCPVQAITVEEQKSRPSAENRFDDRVAIVTGSGRGLGRYHASLLATRGASVVVNDLGAEMDGTQSSHDPADTVVEQIISAGGRAVANYSDVSTSVGAQELADFALRSFGRIDIVVNNAGILRDASVSELTMPDWGRVIDVNLTGAFLVAQAAWKHMVQQQYGRIINTSSAAGLFGSAGHANYASAKMGLLGLTQALALEGSKYGILANAIVPAGLSRMFGTRDKAGIRNETVSAVVGWLAHEKCSATGEVFWVRRERLARAVIGLTYGFQDPLMSIESIFENLDALFDTSAVNFPGLGGRG